MTESNTPISVKRRARKATAIRFNGKNGKTVVEWFRLIVLDEPEGSFTARNGGAYVKFQIEGRLLTLRNGQWLVVDADDDFKVYNDETFEELFLKGAPLDIHFSEK